MGFTVHGVELGLQRGTLVAEANAVVLLIISYYVVTPAL